MKVGLFYGSETGNTKEVAFEIKSILLGTDLELTDEPWDFAEVDSQFQLERLLEYDLIILGSPTWNIGEFQADIGAVYDQFDQFDFTGKKVAVFGCGDADGYPESYQDAMGMLAKKLRERGGQLIGKTEIIDDFESSLAEEEGKLLGLAIDQEKPPAEISKRIEDWMKQLLNELKN